MNFKIANTQLEIASRKKDLGRRISIRGFRKSYFDCGNSCVYAAVYKESRTVFIISFLMEITKCFY
jgi:hypothetical protein